MKNILYVFILLTLILISRGTNGQPMWCVGGASGGTSVFTNIHDNGFDVCFIVPAPGTYNYRYEVRIGSATGAIAQTGYDTKDHDANRYTTITGLEAGTEYYVRAAFQTSSGSWSDWSAPRSITTTVGVDHVTSLNQNYITSISYRTEAKEGQPLPTGKENRTVSLQYYDGLGRPLQDVSVQASPHGKDIVVPHAYDAFGREGVRYLPYTDKETSYGSYRFNAISGGVGTYTGSAHQHFYQGTGGYSNPDIASDPHPYSQTVFEASPLNRPLKQGAPGSAWQPNTNIENYHDRSAKFRYETNTSTDNVRLWRVNGNSVSTTRSYEDGMLYKSIHYDANQTSATGSRSEEYTNMLGQVVLKRVYNGSTVHDTYYVYDDFDNLRLVISPQGSENLNGTSITLTSDFINKWCFYYAYDNRRRVIEKKVPGSAPVHMVYDSRDRLVLVQDGNQREGNCELVNGNMSKDSYQGKDYYIQNGSLTLLPGFEVPEGTEFYAGYASPPAGCGGGTWTYTKYDALNRPVVTGTISLSAGHGALRSAIGGQSVSESFTGTGPYGYSNTAYAGIGWDLQSEEALTVTYYDNYGFKAVMAAGSAFDFHTDGHYATGDWSPTVRGHITGTMARVLDGPGTWTKTVTYYDRKYRPVQTVSSNLHGGHDRNTYTYNFTGQVTSAKRTHVGPSTVTFEEEFEYDHMGRLEKHWHKTGSRSRVLLAEHGYNGLGELVNKKLHGNFDNLEYRYNIRGWLTDINDVDNASKRFSLRLKYNGPNRTGVTAQFNGNIAEIEWRNGNSGRQVFGHGYDGMDRLTGALYRNVDNQGANGGYDVSGIGYDRNGNILSLSRKRPGVSGLMDDLEYGYGNSGNQLQRVIDSGNKNLGFIDKNNTVDYEYDANGNMTVDRNKGITQVQYNHMNLPGQIWIDHDNGVGNIRYIYDAHGNKLKKTRTAGQNVEETMYISGIQYIKEGNGPWQMEFVRTAEGRVVDPMGNRLYEYDIKDHLGNSRVMFSEVGETISEVPGYYPFGMTFDHPNVPGDHKFLYQNKEYQNELGLETYDFEWRMYDPAIARTFQVDPMADMFMNLSPYSWAANNPISVIDPDGRMIINLTGAEAREYLTKTAEQAEIFGWDNVFGNPQDDEDEKEKERKRKNEEQLKMDVGSGGTSEIVQNSGDFASYGSSLIGLYQIGMLEYRSNLSIHSKVGTFSKFSSTYSSLGKFSGRLGTAGTLVGIGSNISELNSGNISTGRFVYRTGFIGTSIAIGSAIGGPLGAVAGGSVGGVSAGAEYIYDNILVPFKKEIQYQIWNFENAIKNGWYPGRR